MSSYEFFVGRFEEAEDQTIFPRDDDDFYQMEEEHRCHYVRVNDKVFKFWSIKELDEYGFNTTIPAQDGPVVLCYWYNGGAGLHEVVQAAIKEALEENQ